MHMNNPTGPVCVFVFAFKIVAAVKGAWKRQIVGLKPVQLLKIKAAGGVKLATLRPETVVSQPLRRSLKWMWRLRG